MRIVCPSCGAAYDVPDSLVPAGRMVRCVRCGGEWTPVEAPVAAARPEAPPNEPVASPTKPPDQPTAALPGQSAMERLAANSRAPEPGLGLRLAWGVSLALLLLAGVAAYVWRGPVIAAWPPSAHVYAAFGLYPQPEPAR
jgi:predicted Zn finger-like uncharacterized protein